MEISIFFLPFYRISNKKEHGKIHAGGAVKKE
jgi:hypothetical protein